MSFVQPPGTSKEPTMAPALSATNWHRTRTRQAQEGAGAARTNGSCSSRAARPGAGTLKRRGPPQHDHAAGDPDFHDADGEINHVAGRGSRELQRDVEVIVLDDDENEEQEQDAEADAVDVEDDVVFVEPRDDDFVDLDSPRPDQAGARGGGGGSNCDLNHGGELPRGAGRFTLQEHQVQVQGQAATQELELQLFFDAAQASTSGTTDGPRGQWSLTLQLDGGRWSQRPVLKPLPKKIPAVAALREGPSVRDFQMPSAALVEDAPSTASSHQLKVAGGSADCQGERPRGELLQQAQPKAMAKRQSRRKGHDLNCYRLDGGHSLAPTCDHSPMIKKRKSSAPENVDPCSTGGGGAGERRSYELRGRVDEHEECHVFIGRDEGGKLKPAYASDALGRQRSWDNEDAWVAQHDEDGETGEPQRPAVADDENLARCSIDAESHLSLDMSMTVNNHQKKPALIGESTLQHYVDSRHFPAKDTLENLLEPGMKFCLDIAADYSAAAQEFRAALSYWEYVARTTGPGYVGTRWQVGRCWSRHTGRVFRLVVSVDVDTLADDAAKARKRENIGAVPPAQAFATNLARIRHRLDRYRCELQACVVVCPVGEERADAERDSFARSVGRIAELLRTNGVRFNLKRYPRRLFDKENYYLANVTGAQTMQKLEASDDGYPWEFDARSAKGGGRGSAELKNDNEAQAHTLRPSSKSNSSASSTRLPASGRPGSQDTRSRERTQNELKTRIDAEISSGVAQYPAVGRARMEADAEAVKRMVWELVATDYPDPATLDLELQGSRGDGYACERSDFDVVAAVPTAEAGQTLQTSICDVLGISHKKIDRHTETLSWRADLGELRRRSESGTTTNGRLSLASTSTAPSATWSRDHAAESWSGEQMVKVSISYRVHGAKLYSTLRRSRELREKIDNADISCEQLGTLNAWLKATTPKKLRQRVHVSRLVRLMLAWADAKYCRPSRDAADFLFWLATTTDDLREYGVAKDELLEPFDVFWLREFVGAAAVAYYQDPPDFQFRVPPVAV